MRAFSLALLGAIAFVLGLVATVPATVVLREAERQSRQNLRAFEERGTLWNGSARIEATVPGTIVALEHVQWQWRPAALLSGRLAFHVTATWAGAQAQGEVARSFTGWQATGVSAQGDAAAFALLSPLAGAWRPEGQVEASASRLTFDGRELRGEARLTWQKAGIALAALKPLGAYRLDVAAEGGPAKLTLTSLEGPLRLAGRGTFTLPSRITFSGDARAEGPQAQLLDPLLDLLGPKRSDGSRALEVRWN